MMRFYFINHHHLVENQVLCYEVFVVAFRCEKFRDRQVWPNPLTFVTHTCNSVSTLAKWWRSPGNQAWMINKIKNVQFGIECWRPPCDQVMMINKIKMHQFGIGRWPSLNDD